MHGQLALDSNYNDPSLSSFKEGARSADEVIHNLKSRALLIGISQEEINESGVVDLARKILDLEDLNFLFFSKSFLDPIYPLMPQLLADIGRTDMGRALLVEINRYKEGSLDQEARTALAKQYAPLAQNWLADPANAVHIQNITELNCSNCDLKVLPKEISIFHGTTASRSIRQPTHGCRLFRRPCSITHAGPIRQSVHQHTHSGIPSIAGSVSIQQPAYQYTHS